MTTDSVSTMGTIWVDADACPVVVKDILYRVANRVKMELVLVANAALTVPASPFIRTVQVPHGFDVADNYIVTQLNPEDILVTADIPLAGEALDICEHVISPRGELLTKNTIKQRLSMRNFMEELRSTGENIGGPKAFTQQDRMAFANTLDRLIARRVR